MRWNIHAYLFIGHFSFLFYESSLHSFIPFVFIDGIIFFKSMICRNSYCRYFPQFDICISVWFIRLFALKKVLKEIYLLFSHSYYLPLPFLKWFMALFFHLIITVCDPVFRWSHWLVITHACFTSLCPVTPTHRVPMELRLLSLSLVSPWASLCRPVVPVLCRLTHNTGFKVSY